MPTTMGTNNQRRPVPFKRCTKLLTYFFPAHFPKKAVIFVRTLITSGLGRVARHLRCGLAGAPVFGFLKAGAFNFLPAARGASAAKALRSGLLCRGGSRSCRPRCGRRS